MTLRASVPHPLKIAGRAVSVRVGSATAGARQLGMTLQEYREAYPDGPA